MVKPYFITAQILILSIFHSIPILVYINQSKKDDRYFIERGVTTWTTVPTIVVAESGQNFATNTRKKFAVVGITKVVLKTNQC